MCKMHIHVHFAIILYYSILSSKIWSVSEHIAQTGIPPCGRPSLLVGVQAGNIWAFFHKNTSSDRRNTSWPASCSSGCMCPSASYRNNSLCSAAHCTGMLAYGSKGIDAHHHVDRRNILAVVSIPGLNQHNRYLLTSLLRIVRNCLGSSDCAPATSDTYGRRARGW